MDLERSNIQRGFSQARKGYDPQEVDRHLRSIADAVEDLKAAPPRQSSLAGTAAERVESIVSAAEASAREIEERARADADEIRRQAEADAARHLQEAEAAAGRVRERAAELEAELGRLIQEVGPLQSRVPVAEPELPQPAATVAPAREPEPELEIEPEPEPELEVEPESQAEPVPELEIEPEPEPKRAAKPAPATGSAAPEGARLIALNMALGGTPREETARYLRENFDLDDEDGLLDDVYAKVGG